jgi:hypothetical protein
MSIRGLLSSMLRDVATVVIRTLQQSVLFKTCKTWGQWKICLPYRAIVSVTTNLTLQNVSKYNRITRDIHHGTDEWYFQPPLSTTSYQKRIFHHEICMNWHLSGILISFVKGVKFYAHCSKVWCVCPYFKVDKRDVLLSDCWSQLFVVNADIWLSLPKLTILKLAGLNAFKIFGFSNTFCWCRRHCLGLRRGLEVSGIWVLRKIFGAKKEVEKSGFSNFMVMSAFLYTDYQIVLLW